MNLKKNIYISTPARVLSIIQLSLGLICFLWIVQFPFMGSLYYYKSEALLYESIGIHKEAARNTLFERLEEKDKGEMREKYIAVKKGLEENFWKKMKNLFRLFFEISPFEMTWVLLAITIPILLLVKKEGAVQAAWLLPLVTFCYCVDNQISCVERASIEKLFPSEEYLVSQYLRKPLGESLEEQKKNLLLGWQLYLVEEWAKEKPEEIETLFRQQVGKGEFAFNLNRIRQQKPFYLYEHFREKRSPYILALFLLWNLAFASSIYILLFRREKFDCI